MPLNAHELEEILTHKHSKLDPTPSCGRRRLNTEPEKTLLPGLADAFACLN